jgi:hypothetical protein
MLVEPYFTRCKEKNRVMAIAPENLEIAVKLGEKLKSMVDLPLKTFASNDAMNTYMKDNEYGIDSK